MRLRAAAPLVVVASALFGSAFTVVLGYLPGLLGVGAVCLALGWALFLIWPWAVLPVSIVGTTLVAYLVGATDVRSFVAAHMLTLAAGTAALVTRRLLGHDVGSATVRLYRTSVMIVLATVVIGALYGLAVGNAPREVLVAAYQIAVIPAYFLITVYTLDTPARLRNAAILFVATIFAITAISLLVAGRHGGLLSLLALPTLVLFAGRARGWKRAGFAVMSAILTADVVFASFRGVWIAGVLALAILLVGAGRPFRQGVAASGVAGGVLLVLLALNHGVSGRLLEVTDGLSRSAGYRGPESAVGWSTFLSHPFFGAGLGETTRHVYLPGFTFTDVGPVYHSFYILLLANVGAVGLAAVMWPVARSVWSGLRSRQGVPLTLAALTCGCVAAAFVEAPTDGHWELGVLPALILLTLRTQPAPVSTRRTVARADRQPAMAAGGQTP